MKVVIDIPDEDYNVILENANFYIEKHWGLPTVWDAIVKGTPLPRCERYFDMTTDDELLKAYHEGIKNGTHLGLAMGRFFEKHGITDKIPPELAEDVNTVIETALAECHNLDSEYGETTVKILLNTDE